MSKSAAETIFRKSGLTPQDVQVIELHDCFSANELITYEALGLCPPGGWTVIQHEGMLVTEDGLEWSTIESLASDNLAGVSHGGWVRVVHHREPG